IGLVDEVADDLDAAVERAVGHLLAGGPEAVRAAKRLVHERPEGRDTATLAASLRTSPEGQEGLRAFLDKRPARLPGGGEWGVFAGKREPP
ncbi:MAG: hypothetical protein ACRDMU_04290, partial [Gaiellaceae bacterium]